MTIHEHIYAQLSGYAPLAALVGTRISAGISKQGETNPRVRYICFGGRPEQTHGGEQDLRDFVLQVDAIGDTYDDAQAVATAVRDCLKLAQSPRGNVWTSIENDGMDIPEPDNAEFRVMVEARIWHAL